MDCSSIGDGSKLLDKCPLKIIGEKIRELRKMSGDFIYDKNN